VSNDERIIIELLRIWKQAVIACIKLHCPDIWLEGLKELVESRDHEGR
jgi:hypothetical protein